MRRLGTDIKSDWSFNSEGDLNIVSGVDNLGQAISNRLNTYLGDLDLFYQEYGSTLFEYLGEINHETIHEYIRIEIEHAVSNDKRVREINVTVLKKDTKSVECKLDLVLVNNKDVGLNMIISAENIVILNGGG